MTQRDMLYGLIADQWQSALRECMRSMMPEPPQTWLFVRYPVWVRGTLVSHQPIRGGHMEWRYGAIDIHDPIIRKAA